MSQLPNRKIIQKGAKRGPRKLKVTGTPTKAESEWMDRIAELGCILTIYLTGVRHTPGCVHHLLTGRIPGRRSPHSRTICLRPEYHEVIYPQSIHALGVDGFERVHGISEEQLWRMTKDILCI